ncbi:uncharacterized protein Z518_09384 [Rhinocladiella mackenziei CBS 650.93]|uniref:Nonribosomal peptide synthetase sidC n=1 Tax=Rhinocladiella mackenziei CBS 650.93 TaxID=1442369 RepID=A0A0D2GTK5_9EURO|nr:uncharacterized protein Z518_09384 [Rhinocladiella mackenziei CBS 650.93]KIX01658.1 hypothetical protein Z518_09384 [Rhinocladiella mackenziei CBS 650.93]
MDRSVHDGHVLRDLAIVNKNRQTLPGPTLLHELIASTPSEELILDFLNSDGSRVKLTYDEFHRLTDILSRDIGDQISRLENRPRVIPVILPQCPELYITWVAVLKAGAGFCPVSQDVPPERLKFIVKDVEASFVLTTATTLPSLRDLLPDARSVAVSLKSLECRLRSNGQSDAHRLPLPQVDPSGPAYVMYTSGSTGLPKGVMVSHRSVSQSLLAHDEHIPSFKRFLQFASPTFDVSIFEIFFPFYRGATLVGCERERMLSDLPATIQLLNADAAELTPTVAGTLLRTRRAAPGLQTLLTIGEMLTSQVVSEFGGDSERPSMLYAMYGPTEAAIHCTLATKLASTASVRRIGRPLATVTAVVLKESERPEIASMGESGELAVTGQLADGYLNRPDQNKAAFVELPGYGAVYKTGDRAICRPDGELEILGRMASGQVKLRGQRVELGEIEEVASKVHGLQLAIAIVIDDVLVLFCAASQEVRPADVSTMCKSWLPPYMRPGEIVFLQGDEVPRLPSGKVDRKALERDFRESRPSAHDDEEPKDRTERDLARVLEEELGRKIDRSTSLWSLGLDSLRTIKIASKLRQKYPFINAALFTERDNVAELAALVKSSTSSENYPRSELEYETSDEWQAVKENLCKDPTLTATASSWESLLPCSSMQVAMLAETAKSDDQNFNEIRLSLASEVKFEDLRRAFHTLGRQNRILRSGFISTRQREMPFAQVVWQDIRDTDLNLLHPLQITRPSSCDEGEAVVRIHHALYDGWSWDLVLDDLNDLLSGRKTPQRTQFSEFQSYQRSQMLTESVQNNEYWHDLFQDFVPCTFPNLCSSRLHDRPRSAISVPLSISYRQLSEIALSLRCSRETILESAWALILALCLNNQDVAIGVVSANRHIPLLGVETIIGPCLSTMPLRVDIHSLMTAHDLINHIQRQRSRSLKYGNVTLRDINRAAGVTPGHRLFDTLCVWQEGNEDRGRDRSKVTTTKTFDALDYAVVLEFEPRGDQVHLKLTVNQNLMPEPHAKLLAAQLDDITIQMVKNPQSRLDCLWEMSNENIMSTANTQYATFKRDFSLTTSISDLAQNQPERVAVEFVLDFDPDTGRLEKETLTYRDLFSKASLVASTLQTSYAIRENDLVCLIAARSIPLYIGILGSIMAGAGYMCIDPRTPADRIRQIWNESKGKVALTDQSLDSTVTSLAQNAVPITDVLDRHIPGEQSFPDLREDQLAYAVFTSGSTGVPKGVLITRKNLLSNLGHLSRLYPCVPAEDRILQACSPAFDVSVFEIFWTWHMGMTLCTASNDVLFRDLEQFIDKLNVTHLSMTPSVAALVRPQNVPRVKFLVTAGEPMNSKVFTDWAGRGLYQGYGPSETTNICNIRPKVSRLDAANNVGPALSNTSIFVCQTQKTVSTHALHNSGEVSLTFRLVPKGGVGEIWIGGEQVGRGYIDPALTAKSFLDHPQYGRLYRSGDIGRLLADDSLVIMGREDDQVKLRGQRIELGDIDSSLVRCDEVEDAVTMIIQVADEISRLVSFWTPRQPDSTSSLSKSTSTLYAQLRKVLPSYMIPDTLLRLDQIPLTRQGKIDRQAMISFYQGLDSEHLQAVSRDSDPSGGAHDLSESERRMAQIISDILGVRLEIIKRNSSFYALGLDSINAIRVARSLKENDVSGVEISTLLQNPSIGQLMAVLKSDEEEVSRTHQQKPLRNLFDDKRKDEIIDIYARAGLKVEKFLPCTPLQESMATSSMNSSSRAYQNSLRFKIYGDMVRLREAWSRAISRHQLLRTGFASMDSAETPFVQVVLESFELPWMDEDARGHAKSDLDFLMLPPWSVRLDKDGNNYQLTLEIHHCLYDAEALSILLSEIESSYHDRPLQPPIAFDTYLSFMEDSKSPDTDHFWRKTLYEVSACRLDELIQAEDKLGGGKTSTVVREATLGVSEFQKCVRRISSTALALFQATWSRLLFSVFQREDVCFGNVLSGRNLPIEGIDRLVAPCFNTVPTRTHLQRGDSNSDLCHNIQQMNIEVLPYQPSSLRRIQRQSVLQGKALFDTLLLLQQDELQLDHRIWTLLEDSGDMSFPFILEIVMNTRNDGISLKLHSEAAKTAVLTQLLECFDLLLSHTSKFPQARALDSSVVDQKLPTLKSPEGISHLHVASTQNLTNGAHDTAEELSDDELLVKEVLSQFKPDLSTRLTKDTTIFQLGFDSINAVQIAARLRKQGISVSSADILEAASVGQIAALCDSTKEEHQKLTPFDTSAFDEKHRKLLCLNNDIDEAEVESIRPCTHTQSGILSQYLRSNRRLYLNKIYLRLDNDIDLSRLKESWIVAKKTHEMLRTGFAETDHPQIPFAMVTYRPDARQLPWLDSTSSPTQDGASTKWNDGGVLAELPWELQVSTTGASMSLELSILHALYDAQSLDIILRDVACMYRDIQPPKPIAPSPVISQILAMSRDEGSKPFWLELSADLCSTRFPDMKIYSNKSESFRVTSEQCRLSQTALEKACALIGATTQAVCVSAWSVILSAYTAQTHVTFGIILSGRDFNEEGDNEVAFPCINTVPFAIEVSQDLPDLLKRTVKRCAGVMKHQYTPLSSIKRWAGIEDELFDTVMVLQKSSSGRGPQRPWTQVKDDATAEYAVSIEIIPREDDSLDFQLTFRESIVPPEQAAYILQEFGAVIECILNPTRGRRLAVPNSLLSVVPAKDERIGTEIRHLHGLVESTAKKSPDKIALEFVSSINGSTVAKQSWTYSQLNASGNKIAHLLQDNKAQVGELIVVCFEKCPEASFAILGVQKAGCGYLAIDPGAPKARKEFILRDSGSKVVLTTRDKKPDFPLSNDLRVIAVDDGHWQNLSDQTPVLSRDLDPQDICYCLYTSGTTGTPKGCLISHDSAVQAMLSFQRIFEGRWNESSRWLQFASFHFDVSVLEQYWSWSVGIRVTSAPRDLLFEDLPGTINALKITHLDLTPSLARMLSPEDVPSLCQGVFIVGGELVRQDILETWGDTGCLYNFYGPSEVTIGCTVHRQVPKGAKPTNIGQQWDNVGSFVLDPTSQNPVLRGAIGELCLSGPLVGKGYLNRLDLTANKFVTLRDHKARVYCTGDLVRLLHDDSFEFLGRIDDQVKLRGQRLEIGEINHVAMSASTSLQDATTMVLKHPTQQKEQLVTFFSTTQSRKQSENPSIMSNKQTKDLAAKIQRKCADQLPAYMVPTYCLGVSSLPLSVNNKVDHQSLKALYERASLDSGHQETNGGRGLETGNSEAVRNVIKVLATFLQIPTASVTPTSRLFELGLDSVSAIGLSRSFRKQGFQNIDVATILRHPVVTDLARVVNRPATFDHNQSVAVARSHIQSFAEAHHNVISRALEVTGEEIEYIAPCTPLQEGMVSKVMRAEPEDTVYFSCFMFKLNVTVEIGRLRDAWNSAQQAISILRTHFVPTEDGFAQVVLRKGVNSPILKDIENGKTKDDIVPGSTSKDWARSVKAFGRSTPWKVQITTSGKEKWLVIHIFHGLYDGVSLPLLVNLVKRLYDHPQETPKLDMQFYEALPYGPLRAMPDEEEFWKSALSTLRPFKLSLANSRTDAEARFHFVRDEIAHVEVKGLCNKLNVTASAFFEAALLYSLYQMFKVNPSIGVVVSGRALENTNFEEVIGPMFNTIPCAINQLDNGSTVVDLIQACHRFNVDVLPYQHTPLRRIAKHLGLDPHRGLFDILFVFHKSRQDVGQSDLWQEVSAESVPDYPLNIEVKEEEASFQVAVVTRSEYLSREDTSRLLEMYLDTVQNAQMESVLPDAFYGAGANRIVNGVHKIEDSKSSSPSDSLDQRSNWTETEITVRTQLAELASVEEDTIRLNRPTIFELGLDSIEAMKLATRLRNIGLKVAMSAILKSPTVAGIAREISSDIELRSKSTGGEDQPSIAQLQESYRHILQNHGIDLENVERIWPVTPMQEGLLAESHKYSNIMVFKVNPGTDIKKLIEAWNTVSQTQPTIRTRFETVDVVDSHEAFVQYIVKCRNSVTVVHDINVTDVVKNLEEDDIGIDLKSQYIKIRFVISRNGPSFLVLGMPHALYDAWSLHLLHRQVAEIYDSPMIKEQGAAVGQCEKHLEEVINRSQNPQSQDFWRSQLSDVQPSPFRQKRGSQNHPLPAFLLQKPSSSAKLDKVLTFCKQQGIALQSLGLACWTIALAHYSHQIDVCFGVVLSGRTTEGSENLIFPTFNTVVFRPMIDEDNTTSQVLKKVHNAVVRVSEYQNFPLREAIRLAREQGVSSTLFDTLFTFQKLPSDENASSRLYEEVAGDETTIKPPYPINIEFAGQENELRWTIACQEGVCPKQFGQTLLRQLDEILLAFMNEPDRPLVKEVGDGVSVCGLPVITLTANEKTLVEEVSQNSADEREAQSHETWSSTEVIIREVLARVSKSDRQRIKKTTGFFHLGLDSVSAIKVANLLKKEGLKLPVSEIIKAQTIEKMAAAAEQLKIDAPAVVNGPPDMFSMSPDFPNSLSIPKDDVEAIIPSSAGQIYMLDMWLASGGRLFYPTFWLQVSGAAVEAVRRAMDQLVSEIPILRTTFINHNEGGKPGTWQVVLKSSAAKRYQLPWSLHLEKSTHGTLVAIRIHHALYDAVSFPLILSELQRLCKNVNLHTPLHTNTSDFVSKTLANVQEAEAFWINYLGSGYGTYHTIDKGSFRATRIEMFHPTVLEIHDLGQSLKYYGISIQALFFAAYANVYSRLLRESGRRTRNDGARDEVIIGIYLANRSLDVDGVTGLITPTFNIVPLRVQLGEKTLVETALQIQSDLVEITKMENCTVSMRQIHAWTHIKVDTFVNFLSLPHDDHDSVAETTSGQDIDGRVVRVIRATVSYEEKSRRLEENLDSPSPFFDNEGEEHENTTIWCLPAIDIEAKISEAGHLGIGVFAPEDMLSASQAEGIIDEMRSLMGDFP